MRWSFFAPATGDLILDGHAVVHRALRRGRGRACRRHIHPGMEMYDYLVTHQRPLNDDHLLMVAARLASARRSSPTIWPTVPRLNGYARTSLVASRAACHARRPSSGVCG